MDSKSVCRIRDSNHAVLLRGSRRLSLLPGCREFHDRWYRKDPMGGLSLGATVVAQSGASKSIVLFRLEIRTAHSQYSQSEKRTSTHQGKSDQNSFQFGVSFLAFSLALSLSCIDFVSCIDSSDGVQPSSVPSANTTL